jgi:CBS domain-containing membrane protein
MQALTTAIGPWLRRFIPEPLRVKRREQMRAALGALLGIGITGILATSLLGMSPDLPLLIAPMGASAVLLFAAPASPLAQPWSVIGGNMIAACVGVTCAKFIPAPLIAAACAVSLSIALMFALRCLHPPSGAVALTAVLGGPAIHTLGYGFIWSPVLLNSVILLGCALLYHSLTRHNYPHKAPAPVKQAGRAAGRTGFTREDLETVLANNEDLLSITLDDLQRILESVESHAYHRRLRDIHCKDILNGKLYTLSTDTTIAQAWKQMNRYHIKAFPVVDQHLHLQGIVTRDDFMQRARLTTARSILGMQQASFSLPVNAPVSRLMNPNVRFVQTDTPIAHLIPLFSQTGHHHFPVVDQDQRVVGMVTPADLVSALHGENLHA